MEKKINTNDKITALYKEVRVISPSGKNLGIMITSEAVKLAKQFDLDLIELNATANPPVCKITDFGKYIYQELKAQAEHKTPSTKTKEIDFSARIEANDFNTKISHAKKFLEDGNRVKIVLKFRWREMEHKGIGFDIVNKALQELEPYGKPDTPPKLMGRNINVILNPK